jgi:hypothetical protein
MIGVVRQVSLWASFERVVPFDDSVAHDGALGVVVPASGELDE